MHVTLIRHGRSAHVHAGWIDLAGFRRWREAYEAAGVDPREQPPAELQALASAAGAVVASDTPRALESARLLAPGNDLVVTPLLRELDLAPPHVPWLRLPLAGWALAYGVRMLLPGHSHATPAEHERIREAAALLIALAGQHARVIAVTHATFRSLLAKELQSRGWQADVPRRRSAHWSAWTFTA